MKRRHFSILLVLMVLAVLMLSACTTETTDDFASYRYDLTEDVSALIVTSASPSTAQDEVSLALAALAARDYRVRGFSSGMQWELRMSGATKASLVKTSDGLTERWYAKSGILYHDLASGNGMVSSRDLADRPDLTLWLVLAGEDHGFQSLLSSLSLEESTIVSGWGSEGEFIVEMKAGDESHRLVIASGVIRAYFAGTASESTSFTVKFTKTGVSFPSGLADYPWKMAI